MPKKILVISSLFMLILTMAIPVYAQTPTPSANAGFFGEIAHFFNGLFHQQNGKGQNQGQTFQNANVTPGQNEQGNMMQPNPSDQPSFQNVQQRRLSYLVQQGKITQIQADAILAELTKVQTELKTWADSQGINEAYVLGGPINGEIEQGQGIHQGTINNQQNQTQQFRGGQGSSQNFQQGGPRNGREGDFQPNTQGQGQ